MIRYLPRVKGKRFTDTGKWEQSWYRRLSPPAKALWQWLNDHCDNAGVIEADLELASFQIGQPVDEKHLTEFGDRFQRLSDGKLWLHDFIAFQCGQTLSPDSPAHKSIIKLIQSHGLDYPYPNGTPSLPYGKGNEGAAVPLTKGTGYGIKSKEGGTGETNRVGLTTFEVLKTVNRIISNVDGWYYDNCKVDPKEVTGASLKTVILPFREHLTEAKIISCWNKAIQTAHAAKVDKLAKNPTAYAVACFKSCLQLQQPSVS